MAYEQIIGAFLGVLARTFVPYLVKLKNHPGLRWENKYIVPALSGLILAIIATALISQAIPEDIGLLGSFAVAYTLQELSREAQKALGYE